MIRLHSQQTAASLPHIMDPDPAITFDLMDGRDAFLTMARDKHYEFSSLRRCKFSTLALLYELHNQGRDNFVYTCNTCKAHVETRWHCSVCDVSITRFVCLGMGGWVRVTFGYLSMWARPVYYRSCHANYIGGIKP